MSKLREQILGMLDQKNGGSNIIMGEHRTVQYSRTPNALLIEQTLDGLFKKYNEHNVQERGERFGLHASSIITSDGDFCLRQQVLSLLFRQNQGASLPSRALRIFSAGNYIHRKWQDLFQACKIAVEVENTHWNDYYKLSYTPDAIVNLSGTQYVVEIKSMNSAAYYKVEESKPSTIPGIMQLQLYMHLTQTVHGFVLMENKNDQSFKIIEAAYEPSRIAKYIDRLDSIREYYMSFLEGERPPSRHTSCKGCSCGKVKDCGMADACFNVGIGRIRLKEQRQTYKP